MSKHPAHDTRRQEWVAKELLAPEIRTLVNASKEKSVFIRFDEFDRGCLKNDELVQYWIESGANVADLPALLQERPRLLDVDLIRKQLFHLESLAQGFMPAADLFGGLAEDKQTAAQDQLHRIAEALVQGWLPGHTVHITMDVCNGRPRSIDPEKLLQDLKGVLGSLDFALEKDSFVLIKKRQENQDAFRHRISELAQEVYQKSHLSFRTSIAPDQPFLNEEGRPAVCMSVDSLDPTIAWRIAQRAIGNELSASPTRLVLGILEHHYTPSTAKALESHVTRLKQQYPDRFVSLAQRYLWFHQF